MCVRACVRVCVCVCVCVRARVCVCVCITTLIQHITLYQPPTEHNSTETRNMRGNNNNNDNNYNKRAVGDNTPTDLLTWSDRESPEQPCSQAQKGGMCT